MAEETEEKKKPGIIKRILKWFGLGLLTVLIILGLVFQAPWKVMVLLLIILGACTVLPKPARKWFWLSVNVVVIALVVWVLLPDDTEGWRPYTFDEELADLKAKYAIPDSENAARIYNELLEIPFPDGNEPKFFVRSSPSAKSGPWLSKDHPEMGEWLEEQEGIIQKLMEASKIEECRFPINADLGSFSDTAERLASMRQWAYLLISAANNDIAEGRTEEGLEKYNALLQIAGHAYQQTTMVDLLVGMGVEALALRQFNRFVVKGDATEANLSVIEDAVLEVRFDWNSDFPRFLEYEKLFAKNFLGMFYEINPKGIVRLNRSLHNLTALVSTQLEEMEVKPTYWQRKLFKTHAILGWFYMPSSPQKAAKIIEAKYEKFYVMAETDFDWQKEPEQSSPRFELNFPYLIECLTLMPLEAYYRIHDIYLRSIATKRGGRIIIALRRYKNQNGFWPVNLDDVKSMAPVEIFVDPFNNGPFVYKLTDDSFMLYSKGRNNIDEKGEYNYDYEEEKAEPDDWLIWPPRTGGCGTEEENTDDEQQ